MAAEEDVFGDPKLFEEFERPREPSDRFLLETIKTQKDEPSRCDPEQGSDFGKHENKPATFVLGSSDEEIESDEEHCETNGQSNAKDNKNVSVEDGDTVNGIIDENLTSEVIKGVEESVSDNRGSDKFLIHDLQREIERLKKESILFLLN